MYVFQWAFFVTFINRPLSLFIILHLFYKNQCYGYTY